MRKLTGGEGNITLPGATVREVIDNLESRYPGMKERLCEKDVLSPASPYTSMVSSPEDPSSNAFDTDAEIHFPPCHRWWCCRTITLKLYSILKHFDGTSVFS